MRSPVKSAPGGPGIYPRADVQRAFYSSGMASTATQTAPAAILAADAARAVAGRSLDVEAIGSITVTLRDFERAFGVSSVREAAKMFESIRPIVAPNVGPEIIEHLSGISARSAAFAVAFARMTPPRVPDTAIAGLHAAVTSRFTETLAEWRFSPTFREAVDKAVAGLPQTAWADLAPRAGAAIEDAVVLAEKSTAPEVAEDMFVDLDDLSPEERRELQERLMNAITALGTLVAIFLGVGGVNHATATLALMAILVSIYWRVRGVRDGEG
jgi:hypothetical protein